VIVTLGQYVRVGVGGVVLPLVIADVIGLVILLKDKIVAILTVIIFTTPSTKITR